MTHIQRNMFLHEILNLKKTSNYFFCFWYLKYGTTVEMSFYLPPRLAAWQGWLCYPSPDNRTPSQAWESPEGLSQTVHIDPSGRRVKGTQSICTPGIWGEYWPYEVFRQPKPSGSAGQPYKEDLLPHHLLHPLCPGTGTLRCVSGTYWSVPGTVLGVNGIISRCFWDSMGC